MASALSCSLLIFSSAMPNLSKTSTEFFNYCTFISSFCFDFKNLLGSCLLSFTPSQSFELKCYLSKCGKYGYFTFCLIIPVSEIFGSFSVVPPGPISVCFVIFYLELPILLAIYLYLWGVSAG